MHRIVYMNFHGPVHIGKAGFGLEISELILHSDTLYSALYLSWLKLYDEALPEIHLSSAFPFVGEARFYPRPHLPLPGVGVETIVAFGKALKGLRYVAEPYFRRWIEGRPFTVDDLQEMLDAEQRLKAAVDIRVRPQVQMDRLGSDSNLYFVGETFFQPHKSGLYFFVDVPDEWGERFQGAVEFLGDEGIGGRRSLGYGAFTPQFQPPPSFDLTHQADRYVLLSLYHPKPDEQAAQNLAAYHLVERTGWTEGRHDRPGLRHKRVYMVGEGSVLYRPVEGDRINVAPDGHPHPVYRFGKAYVLGSYAGGVANDAFS